MIGIGRSVQKPVQPATEALLNACLDSAVVSRICAEIEDLKEKYLRGEMPKEDYHEAKSRLKRGLPILTPHATFGTSGRRAIENAEPSGLFMMDYDDTPNPDADYEQHIRPLTDSMWGIVFASRTPSGGLRVIATIPDRYRATMTPELAIAAAQMSFADACGLTHFDAACKDLARCSFLVPRDYVYFIDMPRLLAPAEPWPDARGASEERKVKSEKRGMSQTPTPATPATPAPTPIPTTHTMPDHATPTPATATTSNVTPNVAAAHTPTAAADPTANADPTAAASSSSPEAVPENPKTHTPSDTFRGLNYADIIREWFAQNGGEPQPGERNSKLHQLACNLRGICDNRADLIFSILPDYGLSETERKTLIQSALKGDHFGISASMKRVLRKLLPPTAPTTSDATDTADDPEREPAMPTPAMPQELPCLVDLLLKPMPDIYRPAVAHAIFPPLATHMWKTYFRYADNILHECTLMNVLLAETGTGKDCISRPINLIMQDIRERDRINLQREAEWKNTMATKSVNSDRDRRPEGLVIQEIDPDVTNAALVMRLHEADGHFLYTKMNEIDQFDALKGNGRMGQQFQIMCLNFDPENQYGQTRVGWNSVTEKVQVRFNWNASSTIGHGREYFRRVAVNGPISRLNFCTIAQRPIGADIPVYGEYTPEDRARIRTYIDTLNRTTGIIVDTRLTDLAHRLIDHCHRESILSQDRVYENLSFRACVIAWLKICCLYTANGCQWEDSFTDFALWSLDYDLHCKMTFFGEMIANAAAETSEPTYRRHNLLNLLPNTFSTEQARAVRKLKGKSEDPRNMLSVWTFRKLIRPVGKDMYEKIQITNNN